MQAIQRQTDEKRQYLASEIFDFETVRVFGYIQYALGVVTVSLTSWLIYAIVKKTPPPMASLKLYLIPYCICMINIELFVNIYVPFMFHPFVYFYPSGLAGHFPSPIGFLFVGFGYSSAIGLLDCSICILLERFFALRNIQTMNQEKSIYTKIYFGLAILSAVSVMTIGVIITLVPGLGNLIFVPEEEVPKIVNSTIIGMEALIDLSKLLIFQGPTQNSLPYAVISGGVFASTRVALALIIIIINSVMTQILKYQIPPNLQKINKMILRMSIIQFLSLGVTIGGPVFCICIFYWFLPDPFPLLNYAVGAMHWFGLIDSIIMISCIKPYSQFFIEFFGPLIGRKKNKIIAITSVQLTVDATIQRLIN